MFLKSIAFIKDPTSTEALCGMSGGVRILSLGWGKGRGVDLSCSGLGQESKEGTCYVGLRTSHIFVVVPSEQGSGSSVPPGAFCGIPACKPSVSGLCCSCCPSVIWAGLGAQARGVLSVRCLVRIRTVAGAAPLPRQAHMSAY